MDNLDFSEEEIQEQLALLGYRNIPKHRLHEFKQDLDELIRRGEWKTLASPTQTDAPKAHPASAQPSPPAFTKEKVSHSYFQGSDEGFFLHPSKTFHESQLHTTSHNRRCEQQRGNCDSYARHSVAPKLQLPSGAPSRLQVEQDPEDALHPSFTDSYTSPPDSQGRRLIKRKVLRKHEGQSLVCDESFYSEDSALCLHSSLCTHLNTVKVSNMYKMYNAQWDEESEDDKNSLNSSFWSDEEKEEEEEVEIERVVSEEESKVVAKTAEATLEKENGSSDEEGGEIKRVVKEEELKPVDEEVESSQEEKPDMKNQKNLTRESSEDGSDEEVEEEEVADDEEEGSDDEEEEEEEDEGEATEQEVNEDKSKLVAEEEESFQEDSEEETPEVKNQENFTGESSEDEREEEEEEEEEEGEIERVVNKEESKPVDEASQEASEEKQTDMKNQENFALESSEDGSDEEVEEEEEGADDEEEGTEDEEETKQEVNEEESKLVEETEDFLLEASEEETPEVKNQEKFTTESCEDASDEEEEEEEEEMERVANKDISKPVAEAEDFLQEASEEETPEVKNQENVTTESSKCGGDDDEKEEEEEGNVTSSCSSPAQSLMTSGYGTYRPEEQEGGDYRDDHTITEFDQDSRGDVSEMRDYEEDNRSLSSFGGFEIESTRERGYDETRPESALESEDKNEPGADRTACSSRGRRHEELDVTNDKSQENEDLHTDSENTDVSNERSEGRRHVAVNKDEFWSDEKNPEEGTGSEKLDEEERDVKVETEAEDEDPDESLSNKDIKFIDSKVDFSWMVYDDMEWEGNLRQKKDAASCLEDGLAELHVSSSTHRDFETENEDVTGHSSDEDRISLSAFESYISGMTDSQSDLRPKPKSFIRPVMNQQNVKKTDPVAKYFQYKQFWETFKLPGEKDRRALRWEIRDRLAYEPPPKPRRVLVPNTYIVPTEKKRSALRWEIRSDLANGLLPHKFND